MAKEAKPINHDRSNSEKIPSIPIESHSTELTIGFEENFILILLYAV
ncbi:hypothetical protein WN51_09757 [Melipona quadrifasciata]|uniref:Uncharacterized protein n=1 Tax=Melipona quadrifasciata TaxID=166423 RepID=A0A0M9A7C7_9HYME|nr:hypothetical protein WN51_09757 [Melipona quadrifasciata]